MDNTQSILINIVVWAEDIETASKLAADLTGSQNSSNEIWSGHHEGADLKAYIRYADGQINASPVGVTDVLVVQLSGSISSNVDTAKNYIDLRKGIPLKFVTSEEDLTEWASQYDSTFINLSEISSSQIRSRLVTSVKNLDKTLRTAFEQLDLNHNGFITADELLQASASLGHQLNQDEANSIVNALSNDGNISYDAFKRWWIMGRGDFNTFRKIVHIEMSVGNFIKKGSQAFNNYLEKLGNEAHSTTESSFQGRVNISPVHDFENGIGLSFDMSAGKDAENIYAYLPEYYRTSPVVYGLEIIVEEDSHAAMIVGVLDGLKSMASLVPQLAQVLEAGLKVNFRHIGRSVFIDISIGGLIANQIVSQLQNLNFESLNFWGVGNAQIFSGIKPIDILNSSLDELLEKVCNFKIVSHSEYSNVKLLISAIISGTVSSLENVVKPNIFNLLKVLGAIKLLEYEFRYDSGDLSSMIKELIGTSKYEEANSFLIHYQQTAASMIEQFKPMVDMFIEQWKEPLKMVNFDRIGLISSIPKAKIFLKTSLHLPGITAFLRENILS